MKWSIRCVSESIVSVRKQAQLHQSCMLDGSNCNHPLSATNDAGCSVYFSLVLRSKYEAIISIFNLTVSIHSFKLTVCTDIRMYMKCGVPSPQRKMHSKCTEAQVNQKDLRILHLWWCFTIIFNILEIGTYSTQFSFLWMCAQCWQMGLSSSVFCLAVDNESNF